jgi:hypothetical protein
MRAARCTWRPVLRIRISAAAIKKSLPDSKRPESKRFLTVSGGFRPPTPLHSAILARREAALARGSVPPALRGVLGLSELPGPSTQSTAADGGHFKGIRASARADGGGPFVSKIASFAALAIQIIGSNRYAGPNRSTAGGPAARRDQAGQPGHRGKHGAGCGGHPEGVRCKAQTGLNVRAPSRKTLGLKTLGLTANPNAHVRS